MHWLRVTVSSSPLKNCNNIIFKLRYIYHATGEFLLNSQFIRFFENIQTLHLYFLRYQNQKSSKFFYEWSDH